MKKIIWLSGLLFILLLAGALYFYRLGSIPSGFYVDEATIAYNARSVLETGKDEYGKAFPLVFRLMGSYSPPLFVYLSALLIRFFGDGIVVFRSVSAVAVLGSVVIFYLLARRMALYKFRLSYFVVALFLAVSPWLVFNARLGYETTLGFGLFNLGVYFLYLAITKPKNLIAATLILSLASYVSYNQRLLGPLTLLLFIVVFKDIFFKKQNLKFLIWSVVAGGISQIPNLPVIITPAFWTKSNQFNPNYVWMLLSYLSPRTLFYSNPDIDLQHTLPRISLFYDWQAIPYIVGLYLLLGRLRENRYRFLAFYFLVTVVPAAFLSQFVSVQRSLPFALPLALVVGLGIDRGMAYLKPPLRYLGLGMLLIYSLVTLYASYFVLFPRERANAWNYGYDRLADYIAANPQKQILIDDTRNPRTYVLLLYYLRIPPAEYQAGNDPFFVKNYYQAPPMAKAFGFRQVTVRQIDWRQDPQTYQLIIGDGLAVSESQAREHHLTQIGEIKDPLDGIIFKIYKTKIYRTDLAE